jgi:hypothetical protein
MSNNSKRQASFTKSSPSKKAKNIGSEENETTSAGNSLENGNDLNVEEDIESIERVVLIEDNRKLRSHVWNNFKRYS